MYVDVGRTGLDALLGRVTYLVDGNRLIGIAAFAAIFAAFVAFPNAQALACAIFA